MASDESCNQPKNHHLCANGCGFFGSDATLNLCSKCYRDFCIKEEQAASAKAAVEKSFNPPIQTPTKDPVSSDSSSSSSSSSAADFGNEASAAGSAGLGSSGSSQSGPNVRNRCGCCSKRVGLTGFKCRCGSTFCGAHRYPEEHGCTFDFKGLGREAIANANPVVKADKLERI